MELVYQKSKKDFKTNLVKSLKYGLMSLSLSQICTNLVPKPLLNYSELIKSLSLSKIIFIIMKSYNRMFDDVNLEEKTCTLQGDQYHNYSIYIYIYYITLIK